MHAKFLAAALVVAATAAVAETVSVKSPDGRNEIRLVAGERLTYQVFRDGKARTEAEPIALTVEGRGELGPGAKVLGKSVVEGAGRVPAPLYKKAHVMDGGYTRVKFAGDWAVDLAARDDGVAYRFATAFGGRVKVLSEACALRFAGGDQRVCAAPNWGRGAGDPLNNSWEGIYTERTVKSLVKEGKEELFYTPLLFRYDDGAAMLVTESDLRDYPGWNFLRDPADEARLAPLMARCPVKFPEWKPTDLQRFAQERGDFLAETDGTRTYPWRVFALAASAAKIPECDIVYALAAPCAIGDASWVKPGLVVWDWWNDWNVSGVDFRAGCNTETLRHYVDFAAENGVPYVIFDAGWSEGVDVMKIRPDIDLAGLIRHAAAHGVDVILWSGWNTIDGREEEVMRRYAGMGAKGFKIDFLDRDDQLILQYVERVAKAAAKYRLVVDFHGMFKPTGIQRTYPNILNFEGVHGLEQLKWEGGSDFPANDCMLVYTRNAAGPMDYTPGAMLNWTRDQFRPTGNRPGSQGTRVHQMALVSLFEAPLQMLADSPTLYRRNQECFDFMARTPVVWDDTVGLAGEPGKFAAIARRKGDAWYVSAITDWSARELELDTSFLGAGEWQAEAFEDGANADRDATDYSHARYAVKAGEKLKVRLMPGGGFTARLTR